MLDAFIIERIRQEREHRKPSRAPVHIELPRQPYLDRIEEPPGGERRTPHPPERGVVIINDQV